MSPEEFISSIINEYTIARKPKISNTKLSRGRSHSVSSVAEDLFAEYLINNDPEIESILIDQPIFSQYGNVRFYPDITVIKNDKVVAFFDLKMDMGWKRDGLLELVGKHQKVIKTIKENIVTYKNGVTKEKQYIMISPSCTYNIVIISTRNSGIKLSEYLQKSHTIFPSAGVYVLCNSKRYHPNSYGVENDYLIKNLEINNLEFKKIIINLRKPSNNPKTEVV